MVRRVLLVVSAMLFAGCTSGRRDTGLVPSVGKLGDELALLDDFGDGKIDGVWRWADADTERREIDNGSLLLEARSVDSEVPGLGDVNDNVQVISDTRVDELAATITVDDFEDIHAQGSTWVALMYQPVAERGTHQDQVIAAVQLQGQDSSSLRSNAFLIKCIDADCTQVQGYTVDRSQFPGNEDAALGVAHRLTVRFEPDAARFVFELDGRQATADVGQVDGFDPANFLAADLRAQSRLVDAAGDAAWMKAHVDDVEVNGNPFDDFSGDHLDPTKWSRGDLVRTVDNGELVLAAGSAREDVDSRCPVRDADGVQEMAATVRVDDYQWNSTGTDTGTSALLVPTARIGGYFYNDGSAGDGSGGHTGEIFAAIGIVGGADVHWYVLRCTTSDCSTHDLIGDGSLGSTSVGSAEDLYIGWNGTHFTFQRGSDPPASLDAVAAGIPFAGPATDVWKGAESRFPWNAQGTGYIRAAFSNFRAASESGIYITRSGTSATWQTEGDSGGGLASLVTMGQDPGDPTRALLDAVQGGGLSCATSGCESLSLVLPYDGTAYPTGTPVDVTATWHEPGSGDTAGTGTVQFTQMDGIGHTAAGTYDVTFGDGSEATGQFSTEFLADAVPPVPGASTPGDATVIDANCATWAFCNQSASTGDRDTWFQLPTNPGEARAVRLWGGAAQITLYDTDGTQLCQDQSSDNAEATCRGTASGGSLGVEVHGLGGMSPRVQIGTLDSYAVLPVGAQVEAALAGSQQIWFRVPLPSASDYQIVVNTEDQGSGNLQVFDDIGDDFSGNGWCCSTASVHQRWVGQDVAGQEFWFRAGTDQNGSTYQVEVDPANSGATPAEAIQKQVGSSDNDFTYVQPPDAPLYVAFTPDISGAYQVQLQDLGWALTQTPLHFSLFDNPSNPAHSVVLTADVNGTQPSAQSDHCDAVFDNTSMSWLASCWALLQAGHTYYAKLTEQTPAGIALGDFRAQLPYQEATIATLDVPVTGSLDTGADQHFDAWTATGGGLEALISAPGLGGQDYFGVGWQDPTSASLGHWIVTGGYDEILSLVGSKVPEWIDLDLSSNASVAASYTVTFQKTGTGEDLASPMQVPLNKTIVNDWIDGNQQHYFSFTAPGGTSSTLYLSGDYTGQPQAALGLDITDTSGLAVSGVSCTGPMNTTGTEFSASCSATFNAAQTYIAQVTNPDSIANVHYTLSLQ